jgi:hypothetical protein
MWVIAFGAFVRWIVSAGQRRLPMN